MQKLNIILETIQKNNLDGLVLFSTENRFWYTNFDSSAGFLFFNKEKKSIFLIDGRYYNFACEKLSSTIDEIILLDSSKKTLIEYFEEILKKLNIKKLGIELEYTTLKQYEFYKKLNNIELVGINSVVLRSIKTETEIQYLQKAADIAAETIEWVKKQIQPGMTELYVANMISKHMLDLGASKNSFDPIVASGINTANPHHKPSDKVIELNEMITVDIGCIYKGYCSDITRSFILGDKITNPKLEKIYNIVLKAQLAGIKQTSNKISGHDLDLVCRNIISETEYKDYFCHSTGHGVGIEVHEEPVVSFANKNILLNNSVITIEPGIYVPGVGGVRIEDTIVVKNDEPIILTKKANKKLFSFE